MEWTNHERLQLSPISYKSKTRRPASTGIFFARIQKFRSTYANSYKRDYSVKSGFRKFSTDIKSTTDFYIICKRLRSNFFVSVPKNFVGEHFSVSENFGHRKSLWIKGGEAGGREYHDFLSKIFCLTVPKNFVGESFSVSLISGIEKFYAYEGNVTIFYRKFVVSQYRNTS